MRTLVFLTIAVLGTRVSHAAEGTLDIFWIDVEGGAATLIVTPAGESVLVDTGNPGLRDARRIVDVATRQAKLRQIDHLVTTHYHGDHFGGAETLAGLLPIGIVYDNGVFENMPNDPGKGYFEFACEKRVVIQPGAKIPLKQSASASRPAVSLTCLGARQQFIAPSPASSENGDLCASNPQRERDGSDNANSVVLLLEFGGFRFFDAGDLTWNQEAKLVCPRNLVGQVDVYQVTHHGLDSSNNPLVLKTLQPSVAVMNNGTEKGCLPEVFANLKETASVQAIYQVHKNLRPDGSVNNAPDEYIANHKADCAGHPIRLTVAPDSRSYTVRIEANSHERTFKTR